jgi:hypothetical protein
MPIAELMAKVTGKDSEEPREDFREIDEPFDPEGPDPKPKRPEAKGKTPKPAPPRVPPHVRKEVEDKLGAMLEFFALGWEQKDPYCAGKLDDQREEITKRAMVIITKRPAVLRWFTEGSDWQDWLMLATAIQPVTVAIWAHHVAHSAGPGAEEELEQYGAPLAA